MSDGYPGVVSEFPAISLTVCLEPDNVGRRVGNDAAFHGELTELSMWVYATVDTDITCWYYVKTCMQATVVLPRHI